MAPDAREIRGYRLTAANVAKVDQVTSILDRLPPGPSEAPRSDVAMAVVLAMSFAYNEPFRDRQVDEMVGNIEGGHPELAAAIQTAGLSTRDYVLTHMALLLAYPVVAQKRQGVSKAPPGDVSADNLAFVESHWGEVDRAMTHLMDRVAEARRRSEGGR